MYNKYNNTNVAAGHPEAQHGYAETDPTGRYGRFDQVLGKGAVKTVYKAIDEVLGMEVAWNQVKLNNVLKSPEELHRLYSEVHLLSTLSHDSIIRFYTSWVDVDRKSFNFITEMFTSGTLREYRKKYRRIDIRAIKSWARQILRGLVYLHGHDPPVIHRDLKCDNIFVNGHLGQVKIGDLGLAAILRGCQSAHSIIGTPEFMAPELYEEDYNELVDVYSFGLCVLEMLTSEYPYSECINPAQIYKKVTSGKLPAAFFRIQDVEARKFVGKCIETASKRLPAKELLSDPFLASDEAQLWPILKPGQQKPLLNDIGKLKLSDGPPRTDMTITGKLNIEDDTIFLKVQIADKDGPARNIFFPFDILNDTPIDVAMEMVKELEINDWEPFEIADMIDGEISALVPDWKKWDQRPQHEPYYAFNFQEGDDEHRHPFQSLSSCSSSQASFSGLICSRRTDGNTHGSDSLQDAISDDTSSQSSSHSGKYSNLNYFSGNENDTDKNSVRIDQQPNAKTHRSTRFGPEENSGTVQSLAKTCYKQLRTLLDSHRGTTTKDKRVMDSRRLTRNRSLVDVRSQLLHRSLVEEVHKRRMSKTAGAVEHIGFQAPYDVSKKVSQPLSSNADCSARTARDGKGKKAQKGRF